MRGDMIISEEHPEPRRQPTQVLWPDLPDLDGLSLEDMRALVQELQVRQAELDAENEVLRRFQYQFGESQREYSEFYDSAPVGYFTISGEGLILEANPTGAGLLGFDKHSLIGKPFSLFVAKDDQNTLSLHQMQVFAARTLQSCEIRLMRRDGSQLHAQLESIASRDSDGNFSQYRTVLHNITKHIQLEQEIQERNEFLSKVLESISHPFYVIDVNNYSIEMANSAARQGNLSQNTTCYTLLYGSSRPCADMGHPCPIATVKETKEPVKVESVRYNKGGDPRNIEAYCYPVFDNEGNVARIIGYCLDITERKQMEQKIQERNQFLSEVLESISHPFYVIDVNNYNIEMANSAARKGRRLQNTTCHDLFCGSGKPCGSMGHSCPIATVKKTGKPVKVENARYDDDGNLRHVESHCYPVFDSHGNVTRAIGYCLDITERKRLEREIRERHKFLRRVLESISHPFYVVNAHNYAIEMANSAARQGSPIQNTTCHSLFCGSTKPCGNMGHSCPIVTVKKTKKPVKVESVRYSKDRDLRNVETHCYPVFDSAGNVARVIAYCLDITERKRLENLIHVQRDLALSLSAITELDKGLRLCVEAALRISDMNCGAFYLADGTSGGLNLVIHKGVPPDRDCPDLSRKRSSPSLTGRSCPTCCTFVKNASRFDAGSKYARVIMSGKPIYTRYEELVAPLRKVKPCERMRAVAIVPIRHEHRVIGCLTVASHILDEVPHFSRDALEAIAAQIGSAIARMDAEAALQQKNRELQQEIQRREQAEEAREKADERLSLISQQEARRWNIEAFVGKSKTIKDILDEVRQLQTTRRMSVLIAGESGTGKELIARAIHFGGMKASGPFIPVNCSTIPGEIAESVLFGHVRGAFTGADTNRKGYFELADGGTLFLDEIGDMPVELQPKLLRVLEDGYILPIGDTQQKRVDVRVLAATNQDLPEKIAEGTFREDLYFRLARFTVNIPPLRERKEDIPLLTEHFVQIFAEEMGIGERKLCPQTLEALEAYHFPGNVRELKNIVEQALFRSSGIFIGPEHLYFSDYSNSFAANNTMGIQEAYRASSSMTDEQKILSYVREHGSISNPQCRYLLSANKRRATYLLQKMEQYGLLVREGENRWSRYRLP